MLVPRDLCCGQADGTAGGGHCRAQAPPRPRRPSPHLSEDQRHAGPPHQRLCLASLSTARSLARHCVRAGGSVPLGPTCLCAASGGQVRARLLACVGTHPACVHVSTIESACATAVPRLRQQAAAWYTAVAAAPAHTCVRAPPCVGRRRVGQSHFPGGAAGVADRPRSRPCLPGFVPYARALPSPVPRGVPPACRARWHWPGGPRLLPPPAYSLVPPIGGPAGISRSPPIPAACSRSPPLPATLSCSPSLPAAPLKVLLQSLATC